MSKTIKAYISTDTSREHWLYSIGGQYVPNGGRSILAAEALDELSRILAYIEPDNLGSGPLWSLSLDGQRGMTSLAAGREALEALRLDLAAFVAPGGPADELSFGAMNLYTEEHDDYRALALGLAAYDANLKMHVSMSTDPTILAGQRDLAVLQQYAEGGRA